MKKIKPIKTKIKNKKKPSLYTGENYYGVLLQKQEWLENVQNMFDLKKPYSHEWQFNYITATGSVEIDEQKLIVAIPLTFYSFEHEVAGATVDYEFSNINNAIKEIMDETKEKFNEFYEKVGKEFTSIFNFTWTLVPFNNVHAHPKGINSFSSRDYKMDLENTGICFPMEKTKEEISYFTSIIQQNRENHIAKWIHTEFYNFTGDVNKENASYEKGITMQFIDNSRKITSSKLHDLFFEHKEKEFNDYQLTDNLPSELKKEGNTFDMIINIFKKIDFEPIFKINKEHIKRKKYNNKKTNLYTGNLYSNGYYTDDEDEYELIDNWNNEIEWNKYIKNKTEKWNELSYYEKRIHLIQEFGLNQQDIWTMNLEELDAIYQSFII